MKKFAIVLAAGRSRRMGTCKTSLIWMNGQNLLTYQTQEWMIAQFQTIVVLGSHNQDKIRYSSPESINVVNYNSGSGKVSSILTGLQKIPENFETLAISAIDQPRSHDIYIKLYQSHRKNSALITAPVYQNKMGHPLIFNCAMIGHLKSITEETLGLRKITHKFKHLINTVEFSDSQVLRDMNTASEYQQNLLIAGNP